MIICESKNKWYCERTMAHIKHSLVDSYYYLASFIKVKLCDRDNMGNCSEERSEKKATFFLISEYKQPLSGRKYRKECLRQMEKKERKAL